MVQATQRPTDIAKQQALAAVGQGYLLRMYTDLFTSLSVVRKESRSSVQGLLSGV